MPDLLAAVISAVPAVRAGLASLLEDGGIEVVESVNRVDDLAGPGETLGLRPDEDILLPHPDVVVLEPQNGIEDVNELAVRRGESGVIVLGPIADAVRLPRILAGRAWGYLSRNTSGDQLLAAVRAVAAGVVVVQPAFFDPFTVVAASAEPNQGDEDLTQREREVLELVALGLPNKTIAQRLHISQHTVKFHIASILSRLGAASRTEAVRLGARRGLISL